MKQHKNNTWIDLTDLLAWKGHFTGIQRVSYEYAKRFSTESNAKFFAYDKIDKRFILITLEDIDAKISEPVIIPETPNNKVLPKKSIIKNTYHKIPEGKRRLLRPYVDVTIYTKNLFSNKLKSYFKGNDQKKSEYSSKPLALFEDGDKIFLPGAGWHDQQIMTEIHKIKDDKNVYIIQHINDILPIYQPQLFAEELSRVFTQYMDIAINNSDMITVISDATKRDLLTYCKETKLKSPKIEVIRLGDDIEGDKKLKKPDQLEKSHKFILAVGTFEIRKNYLLIYQAIKLAQLENRDLPKFVIAGKRGWLSGDILHVIEKDPLVKERIVWINGPSDEELNWLYENCMFSVFPSLAEGWGLPIAESLCHGKMSLVSGTSSMLEIGKGFVDYFLPYDARELLEKINYYIFEDRYKDKNTQVKKNYKKFTWDDSYYQLKNSFIKTSKG